jgi:WhiB family redox-sensing transcriptional regulator
MSIVTAAESGAPVDDLVLIQELARRPNWQLHAACRDESVDLFITDGGGPSARAKQLCARCPVRLHCLRYALSDPDLVGYWGGTSERERRRLRKASRRARAERLAAP